MAAPGPDHRPDALLSTRVAILHWPDDAAVIEYLRAEGRPRLLLVAPDGSPPRVVASEEDWIRLPASDVDVRARAVALEARTSMPSATLDLREDGRFFYRGRWVSLSPTEQGLMEVLISHLDQVVPQDTLAGSIAHRRLSPSALRVHLTRLRRRVAPLGIAVRSIRNRGYALDLSPPPGPSNPRGGS